LGMILLQPRRGASAAPASVLVKYGDVPGFVSSTQYCTASERDDRARPTLAARSVTLVARRSVLQDPVLLHSRERARTHDLVQIGDFEALLRALLSFQILQRYYLDALTEQGVRHAILVHACHIVPRSLERLRGGLQRLLLGKNPEEWGDKWGDFSPFLPDFERTLRTRPHRWAFFSCRTCRPPPALLSPTQRHLHRMCRFQQQLDEVFDRRGPSLVLRLGFARTVAVRHRNDLRGMRIRGKSDGLERVPLNVCPSEGTLTDPKRLSTSCRREPMTFRSTCAPSSPRTACVLMNTMPSYGSYQRRNLTDPHILCLRFFLRFC